MIRAHTFLMRPTAGQQVALGEMIRDHCLLCNGVLQERRDAWHHTSKTAARCGQQSVQFKEIRAFGPERQGRWPFSPQQATLRRLDEAFAALFRRVKAGEKPGCPRFRTVGRFDTVDFSREGDGCRRDATAHDPVTRVRIQGAGLIKVHQHRPVAGRVKTVSVKREGRKWFVVLTAEQAAPEPLPATGSVVGIDLGTADFLADSPSGFVPGPRHGRKAAAKPETAQQALSRCKRGSKRRRKAVETVVAPHRKVRRQRLGHAHKTALDPVREHDVITHEDLKISHMSRAPAPKPGPDQPGSFLPG